MALLHHRRPSTRASQHLLVRVAPLLTLSATVCPTHYFLLTTQHLDASLDEFFSLLETIAVSKEKLLIAGDFNLHIRDRPDDAALRVLDTFDAFGFSQLSGSATHERGSTLDLVLTISFAVLASLDFLATTARCSSP